MDGEKIGLRLFLGSIVIITGFYLLLFILFFREIFPIVLAAAITLATIYYIGKTTEKIISHYS